MYGYLGLLQVLRITRVDDHFKKILSKLDVNVLLGRMMALFSKLPFIRALCTKTHRDESVSRKVSIFVYLIIYLNSLAVNVL